MSTRDLRSGPRPRGRDAVPRADAVAFLQAFVSAIVSAGDESPCPECGGQARAIERTGLTASACLEEAARRQLGYVGPIDSAQYADVIIGLKNRIGGGFSRVSSPAGVVRVVNRRCPFGERVKDAPDLCRMTSSVFGGIAARNFGYAKVELRKRIAAGDSSCDVCVYLDPAAADGKRGTEYRIEGDRLVSHVTTAAISTAARELSHPRWCADRFESGGRPVPQMVCESAAMRSATRAIRIVAPTDATVLVTGETGCGKELVARAIHSLSSRWRRPLVTVNCGAIPETLIESVLFGHERGAFTGAFSAHQGYFERANTGTLFLDEIDAIPLSAQAKLLRVLQEGEFERVGAKRPLQTDVRIVAASNGEIGSLVEAGAFRRDLYYRLNVVPIHIPPLRERREDIPPLVEHILMRVSERYGNERTGLSEQAMAKALGYAWPGNIRELENVLERAFIFAEGTLIEDLDIPFVREGFDQRQGGWRAEKVSVARQVEAGALRTALRSSRGNVRETAVLLGITPRAVRMKLKAQSIRAEDFRSSDPGGAQVG